MRRIKKKKYLWIDSISFFSISVEYLEFVIRNGKEMNSWKKKSFFDKLEDFILMLED